MPGIFQALLRPARKTGAGRLRALRRPAGSDSAA